MESSHSLLSEGTECGGSDGCRLWESWEVTATAVRPGAGGSVRRRVRRPHGNTLSVWFRLPLGIPLHFLSTVLHPSCQLCELLLSFQGNHFLQKLASGCYPLSVLERFMMGKCHNNGIRIFRWPRHGGEGPEPMDTNHPKDIHDLLFQRGACRPGSLRS